MEGGAAAERSGHDDDGAASCGKSEARERPASRASCDAASSTSFPSAVCLRIPPLVRLFVRPSVRSFVRSLLIGSFVRSFVRSFLPSSSWRRVSLSPTVEPHTPVVVKQRDPSVPRHRRSPPPPPPPPACVWRGRSAGTREARSCWSRSTAGHDPPPSAGRICRPRLHSPYPRISSGASRRNIFKRVPMSIEEAGVRAPSTPPPPCPETARALCAPRDAAHRVR